MKLQALFTTYSVIRAQTLNDNDFEDEYTNPYVYSSYDLGDYPEETAQEITPRRVHNNRGKMKVIVNMNWLNADDRETMIYQTLFPNITTDPEFLMNEETILQQDEEICRLGYDPAFPDIKVRCDQTRSHPRPKIKYVTPAKKFRHLKLMILWLQKPSIGQEFGRYCYYGCHCLPEGNHNLNGGGYGVPVDNIDRSCKNFFQCYECAKMEDKTCQGDKVKYKYALVTDHVTGERSIECMNEPGTCSQNICLCDKRWAENLARHEDEFQTKYHIKRAAAANIFEWKYNDECKRSKGKFDKPVKCCGTEYPDKMPLQGGKQCCGYRPFDPDTRDCCSGDKIRPKDTCEA